ncbi:MAG: hypothetical protein M1480_19775 [Bacteroidetes bacterium]|nr:hypothetical protein [Bacteroidota bacterium]
MKTDERIILYLDGQMNEDEKASFEKEIISSLELTDELNTYKKFLSGISDIKNVPVDNEYFVQMIPKFRGRLELQRKLKLLPKLVFSVTTIAAVLIFFIFTFNKNNKNVSSAIPTTVSQTSTPSSYSELSSLSDQFNFSNMSSEELANSNAILDSLLIQELNLTPQSLNTISADNNNTDLNTLVQGINEKEADRIYNEILHKKIY